MDPFSISVGALQIATICASCSVTIIKYIGEIRTQDERLAGFMSEVIALRSTYEGLEESLRAPMMVEAARVASQTSDGAHLWTQVRLALDDSTKTMNRIKTILDEIAKKTGPLRRFKSQLQESLSNGELSRLRARVQFFNATISLPIQMVGIMLQLEQRGMTADHQRQLDTKFISLERSMQIMIREISQPSRTPTLMSGSTLILGAADGSVDPTGKENYLSFAKKILSTASAAASNRSSMSTISPQVDPPQLLELGPMPPLYAQRPQQDRGRLIPDWIPQPNSPETEPDVPNPSYLPPVVPPEAPMPRGKSYEVAYKLTQKHLKLAQEKAEQDNHESAEKSFRKALELLAKNDFSGRIAFQPAEVVLMLSFSCLQQQKYDDAIELLSPVAARASNIFPGTDGTPDSVSAAINPASQPDTLQALAASHLLGEVFRQKGDLEEAKEHALKAFLDRMDELGEHDDKTLESVKLVIEVYRDMEDYEEADAYAVFLEPATSSKSASLPSQPSRLALGTEDETAVASASPPPSEVTAVTCTAVTPQQSKTSRPSFVSKFRTKRKESSSNLVHKTSNSDTNRNSFSRTTTLDDSYYMSVFLPPTRTETRGMTSPSDTSQTRTNSFMDDRSTAPSSAKLERTASIKTLEPTFLAIQQLCVEDKRSKAVKLGISFLEGYTSNVFVIRRDALEKNIKESGEKGLAGTGHGYAPIHFFCELKEECVDEVSLLLKYGADPNAVVYKAGYSASNSPDILSPLHLAIRRGHTGIAKVLLESKLLKPNILNSEGFYPIMAACRTRNYTVVRGLLNHAPKSIPREYPHSWYGNSLLHDAARHCDLRLVEMILETGLCDLDQQDKFGKTPLMHAVIKTDVHNPTNKANMLAERQQVVEKLLSAGANRDFTDIKGLTATQYAKKEQESEGSKELVASLGELRYEMAANEFRAELDTD